MDDTPRRRSGGRRSRRPSARPPADQRAGLLQPRAHQLVLHVQLADAAMRLAALAVLRIVVTLAQPGVDPGEPVPAPLLRLPHRHREPAGAFDRLALHQPQHRACAPSSTAGPAPAAPPAARRGPWTAWTSVARPRCPQPQQPNPSPQYVCPSLCSSRSCFDNVVSTETGCSSSTPPSDERFSTYASQSGAYST